MATGQIAELAELERDLVPDLVGLGRYLGLSAQRVIDIARALDIRTAGELREAAAAGRLRDVPGIGPKTEAQIVSALARETEARSPRGVWLNRARDLVGGIARALDAEPAGDVRRWCDSCHQLAVVRAASRPEAVLARFAELPQIVAVIEQGERHAVGVTVDGVPVELTVPEPDRFGTAMIRATGSPDYVAALEPLPAGPTRRRSTRPWACPGAPPSCARRAFRGEPPPLVEIEQIRGDLHCHTTWSDGRASVAEMARAARARGYEYLAICDHTPAVGAVQGLTPDDVRRQGEEIAAANAELAPFRVLRGIECDILPDGRLDLPDDVLAELDWVQASVHGGQRMPRAEMTKRVEEAPAPPSRPLSQPPHRPPHQPPPGERAGPGADLRPRADSRASPWRSTACPPGSTSAASTCATRCAPASRSSAPPTRTPRPAWTTSRFRSPPRAAGGPRPPTSSTPGRWWIS